MRAFGVVAVVAVGVVLACEPALPKPKDPPGPTSTLGASDAPPILVTEVLVTELSGGRPEAPDGGSQALCGCKLCEPVVSADACTTDADCAPSAPCHAPACVAKEKATPRAPGLLCSEIMMCSTADANACGCVAGKCALHAR